MKCAFCGITLSDRVHTLHQNWCKEQQGELTGQLREEAKALGIKGYANMKLETLIQRIEEKQSGAK